MSLSLPVPVADHASLGEIQLAELRSSDAKSLVGHLNDKDVYLGTLTIPFPYAAEDADRFLHAVRQATESFGHPVHFAIRQEDGQLLGVVGFEQLRHGHRAEIGYWLGRPFRGHGVMTEVVRAASAMAIKQWGLVRLTAHVFAFNAASARVLEKNGYQYEGLLRKHVHKDGRFIDAKLYALVVEDCSASPMG